MDQTPMWRRYLRLLGTDVGADARDEIEHHLDMRTRDLIARGMDPVAARAEARRRFGDVEQIRAEIEREDQGTLRARSRRDRWGALTQDVRYALRGLRRSPGFAAVAILTLALGIGANTAIFSVVNAVLLRPLPYAEPDRLVELANAWEGTERGDLSPLEFFDYRERLRTVASLGAYVTGPTNLTGTEVPERLQAGYLTAGVLPTLAVAPALGRVFTEQEDRPGGEAVAILGHGLWARRYGADPAVVGRTIVLNGTATTVIGVMPEGFQLPSELATGEAAELFLPLAMDRTSVPNRGSHFLAAVGRLRPGVTPDAAARDMARVAAELARDFADDYPADMRFTAGARPLRDAVLGEVRPVLLILLGAVGLVLLIACANVANLMLARSDGRRREMAVRTALGAGRGRLVRQLLVESAVMALLGGAAGILLAVLAMQLLPHVQPPDLPRIDQVGVDGWVLCFAAGVSLLTALLFGLAPAVAASRPTIQAALREGGRGQTAGAARQRFRATLVAAEVALAVVLLVGAGLLLRSFGALYGVDPGFRPEGVLTMRLSLPSADYPGTEAVSFYHELLERVEALPGVQAAGAVTNLPLGSTLGDLGFEIQSRPLPEGAASLRTDWQVVTPDYFDAVGMRVVRGRGIEARDDQRAPGAVVINESLARQHWPGQNPIGERLMLAGGVGLGWATVVGIVGDVRHASLREPPRPEVYLPHAQFRHWNGGAVLRSLSLAVRTTGDPLALASPVRALIRDMDPNLPVAEVRTLAQVRGESVAEPRFISLLLGLFSAIALALAAVGIYGTLAYLVSQRTHEIGVRMALGARAREIVGLIVRQGMTVALLGAAIGMAAAPLLTRLLSHLLYGVTATDLATFAAAPLLLAAVALLASWLPARRATRVDPMEALRWE